jgi:hypothetical protein
MQDSITGDQADALMNPPQRPLADPKNVLTVRECKFEPANALTDVLTTIFPVPNHQDC